MTDFPHSYSVTARSAPAGDIEVTSARLAALRSDAPAEFGGPGDRWSPETLLTAAVGDCLILTFRAVAKASKVSWTSLECQVSGTVDRIDRVTQFTSFEIHAHLAVPAGTNPDLARRALAKAERNCLIARSLKSAMHLVPHVDVAGSGADGLTQA